MKNLYKIIVSFMLIICICFVFASCGKSGKSAYEIAVENGFTGTEEEWLESLKGGSSGNSEYDSSKENIYSEMYNYYLEITPKENQMSFVDFLKYIADVSIEDDSIVSVSDAIRGSVSILSYPTSSDSNVSAGSGIICQDNKTAGDAYIVTNYHNLYEDGASKCEYGIYVYLYGGEFVWQRSGSNRVLNKNEEQRIPATLIGGSKTLDVAVLKITGSTVYKNSVAKPIEFADNHDVILGQKVFSVGNANTRNLAVNFGNVSKVSEFIDIKDLTSSTGATVEARVIRHSAPTNVGNSGGGLFNRNGKLIGMVNARSTTLDVDRADGYGYAIPVSVIRAVFNQVVNSYENDGQFVNGVKKANLNGITLGYISNAALQDGTSLVYIKDKIYVSSIGSTYAHSYTLESGGYLKADDIIYGYIVGGKAIYFNNIYELEDLLLKESTATSIKFIVNDSTCTIHITSTTLKP